MGKPPKPEPPQTVVMAPPPAGPLAASNVGIVTVATTSGGGVGPGVEGGTMDFSNPANSGLIAILED